MESGQAAVLLGVVEQGVLFPKDETHFRCIHHAMSQSSMPSWLHTFASACLSGRCCSPGAASYLADSQRLTGCLVYPEGLPVQLDPLPIPSYSFHGAHMDSTTAVSLGTPEATWASFTGTATLDRTMVHVTTVHCGATGILPKSAGIWKKPFNFKVLKSCTGCVRPRNPP
jgi:hypothetical protein